MIKSNFELQETSIEEFIRILIPEARETDISITLSPSQETDKICIHVETAERQQSFEYYDLRARIVDLPVVMAKSALLLLFNKSYKWGGLTGVRPTKLVRKLLSLGFDYSEIEDLLVSLYLVNKQKAQMLLEITATELKYLNRDYINLYVGIPFCPSKCSYCSFASYEVKGAYKERYSDFITALLEEIDDLYQFISSKNLKVESLYIGGGTPTILDTPDLERVIAKLSACFNTPYLKEFTLEGGRPETLSYEKLKTAKQYGVTRISINPQSFNQKTLDLLNRKHTIEDIYTKYDIARSLGFVINMDFILGLKGESTEDILYSISKIPELKPENVTFHVLALKRASELYKDAHKHEIVDFEKIESAIFSTMSELGLKPYYMYRQKNSFENGENIGYALPGTESLFNIEMIEEYQDTIGAGGGAITKFITPSQIERIVNPKDPIMYINEIKERTKEKFKIYERMYETNV